MFLRPLFTVFFLVFQIPLHLPGPPENGKLGLWPASAVAPEERVFELSIKNRKMAGEVKVIRVKQGDTIKMNWTTDQATEIHLHGYDIKRALKPGTNTSITLKAHATGRFSIVSHGFGKHSHGKHEEEIPLLYLEVHPR